MAQGAITKPGQNNLPATTTDTRKQFTDLIPGMEKHLKRIASKSISLNALYRIFLAQGDKNPKLWSCSLDSILLCFEKAAQTGLYPNTVEEYADLIPVWNGQTRRFEAQYWMRYKGCAQLFRDSGLGLYIRAGAVYEGDEFDYDAGTDSYLRHKAKGGSRNPANITHFYAIAKYLDGSIQFEVMTRAEVDAVRDSSPTKGEKGPWVTHYGEMGKKTLVKRLAKSLPQSSRLQKALAAEDRTDAGDVIEAAFQQETGPFAALPPAQETEEAEIVEEDGATPVESNKLPGMTEANPVPATASTGAKAIGN